MEAVMDLNHLHIASTDVDSSVKFYRDYFDFHKSQKLESGSYFIYNRDGFMIAVAKKTEPFQMPDWFHFGFRLPQIVDVEALYNRMKADGCSIEEDLTKYDDFVFFRCKDPAGLVLEVYWSPGAMKLRN